MRTFTSPLPFMLVVILLASPIFNAYAQTQSLDDKIKQAKEEVQKLDEFVQAASTSDSLKKSLKPVLDNRKAVLKDLEQLKQLPVTLRPKELGAVVGSLEDSSVSSVSAPVTVTSVSAPCSSPDCGSATRMICGRLRPASMDQTLTLIQALPSFKSYVQAREARERAEKAKAEDYLQLLALAEAAEKEAGQWAAKYGNENWEYVADLSDRVAKSKYISDVDCSTQSTPGSGAQKQAVVDLLHWLLMNRMLKSGDAHYSVSQNELDKALGTDTRKLSDDVVRRQIALLNEFIGNVKVIARDEKNTLIGNTLSDKDGNFSIPMTLADKKPAVISTEGDNDYTTRDITFFASCNCYKLNLAIEDRPASLLARTVLGYQQAGAAATETKQNYFFDLFISKTLPMPFKQKVSPDFGDPLRIWGAIRAISVPQSGDFTLGEGAQTIVTNIPKLKANEAARIFDYLGGIEWRIAGNSSLLPSFDRQTRQKFSLSLIAGLGFITPSTPSEDVPVFEIPPNVSNGNPALKKVLDDLKVPAGQKYIAFPRNDRDRFFRQYYGGIRVQTFFFNRHNVPLQRFPAQFDLTIGQNEYVTGGHLRRPVIRFDGYFPLPYNKLEFINLFGTAILNPNRATESTPLILTEAKDKVFTSADVYLIPTAQFNRDYYRFGIGFDFISFMKKVMNKEKAPAVANAVQSQTNSLETAAPVRRETNTPRQPPPIRP